MRQPIVGVLLSLATLWFSGCGGPLRDNANDPGSDRYHPQQPSQWGSLQVSTQRRTGANIPGVSIVADGRYAMTDSNGTAVLTNIPTGQYMVHLTSDKYVTDSSSVTIYSDSTTVLTKQLNGRPHFDSVSVTSERRSNFIPFDNQVAIRFYAKVSDPDGGIDLNDTAVLVIAPFNTFTLTRKDRIASDSVSIWQHLDTVFSAYNVYDLVGKTVTFVTKDHPTIQIALGQDTMTTALARIFPTATNFDNSMPTQFVRSQLYVSWQTPSQTFFSYSFRLKFSNANPPNPDFIFFPIRADSLHITLHDSVAVGNYVITLEGVDDYGNTMRSDPRNIHIVN